MAPRPMRYDTQAIVVLANDLMDNAEHLQAKRVAAGDIEDPFGDGVGKSQIFRGSQITTLPDTYRQPNCRLIILGHGDRGSTVIMGDGPQQTPHQLALSVGTWLTAAGFVSSRIRRIVLHMCMGGGNRAGSPAGQPTDISRFQVSPFNSFGYKFASYLGELTVDVTARTDVVNTEYRRESGVETWRRVVGDRHKAAGDKVYFTVNAASTLENPLPPAVSISAGRSTHS